MEEELQAEESQSLKRSRKKFAKIVEEQDFLLEARKKEQKERISQIIQKGFVQNQKNYLTQNTDLFKSSKLGTKEASAKVLKLAQKLKEALDLD